RQGRPYQARDVGGQSARMRGVLVQAAVSGRTQSRLPVADPEARARTRANRNFQPIILRRGAGHPRPQGIDRAATYPVVAADQEYLERALHRYQRLRELSVSQRNRDSEVLSQPFKEGTAQTFSE